MVEALKTRLVEVGFSFQGSAQNSACQLQAFGIVLHGTAPQREQGQCRFVDGHDLPLASNQLVQLQPCFGESRNFQPPLAGLDQRGGQGGAVQARCGGRISQTGPITKRFVGCVCRIGSIVNGRIDAQVVRQCPFFWAVVTSWPSGQELRCQLVHADGTGCCQFVV